MTTLGTTPTPRRMVLRYWIGLNAIDAILTALALSLGGYEANPLLQMFASHMGPIGMLFVKCLFALAIGGILWERGKTRVLSELNVVMVAIVLYNMLIITYAL